MTAYSAKFSNGHTIALKNSRREYTHAFHWRAIRGFDGFEISGDGFAGSADLARKGMNSETAWIVNRPTRGRAASYYAKDWKPGQITFTEIVEVSTN